MTDEINKVLDERGKTHGLFSENAAIAIELRLIWRQSPNWPNLSPSQQLALDEIALKAARILSTGADPKATEPWVDIAGYAALGLKHA